MRELTDLEMGSVAGGESSEANGSFAESFCSKNPNGGHSREEPAYSGSVTIPLPTGNVSVSGSFRGATVVVKCGGRTEDAARDKEEKDENES